MQKVLRQAIVVEGIVGRATFSVEIAHRGLEIRERAATQMDSLGASGNCIGDTRGIQLGRCGPNPSRGDVGGRVFHRIFCGVDGASPLQRRDAVADATRSMDQFVNLQHVSSRRTPFLSRGADVSPDGTGREIGCETI
jgi:hypothetical protein